MTAPLSVALTHRYRSGFELRIEFEHPLDRCSVTALMGTSGSGKTTILRSLAGLERPQGGSIRFGSDVWFDATTGVCLPPQRRGIGCLFQDYALFPHLSVADNVAFGLRAETAGKRRERVSHLLDLLRLPGVERRMPRELSGGQQQRVALARAVASHPRLLMLDEPLSALDTPTRRELRDILREFLRTEGIPTLIVTHDPRDVRQLADQVVVLDQGRVLQAGRVEEVVLRPASDRVAGLLAMD